MIVISKIRSIITAIFIMCCSGQCTDIKISMKINLNTQRTLSLIYQLRYLSYDAFKSFFFLYIFFSLSVDLFTDYTAFVSVCTLTDEKSILLYYLIIFSSRLFTQTLLLHLLWFLFLFYFFYEENKKIPSIPILVFHS